MTFTSTGKRDFVSREQVPLYLSFTVHVVSHNFLSIKKFLSWFYLLIFYFKKFSTWIWRLPFTVYVKLKLANKSVQAENVG